jgi:hypothetical protein
VKALRYLIMWLVAETSSRYEGELTKARAPDGGFGPRANLPSEPESTALAALALDDADARAWLVAHQDTDGSFLMRLGDVRNESAAALAALALDGPPRDLALDAAVAGRASFVPSTPAVPLNARFRGWPWTRDASGWTEPTARMVLALRLLRPQEEDAIAEGVGFLRDRESVGGGWNYGNRIVLGEDLPPFTQTTAVAVLALQRMKDELLVRGLARLKQLWRAEAEGGLSLALAAAALRANRDPDHAVAATRLADVFARTRFLGDVVAQAWAAIATGPSLERLVVPA